MTRKLIFSFYHCVCWISVLCALLPPVAALLLADSLPDPSGVSGGLLAAGAVLLLLPVMDEYLSPALYFAVAVLGVCAAGVLMGLPARFWLAAVMLLHTACLMRRAGIRYAQLQPLFRNISVWYSVENHARYSYSLLLYLLALMLPGDGVPRALAWGKVLLDAVLYALLCVRVYTGRTCFLRPSRELEIKELIRGNLRTTPVQAGEKTEELARMSRLYARVVAIMEQKRPFLDEGFGLDDLASAVFTNRGYLSRTVNILSGRNFSQFVNYFRVRYGAELIRKDPGLRLISVAQMCGFHSSPSFNAAFKVNMGETPSAYQERIRAEKFAK